MILNGSLAKNAERTPMDIEFDKYEECLKGFLQMKPDSRNIKLLQIYAESSLDAIGKIDKDKEDGLSVC